MLTDTPNQVAFSVLYTEGIMKLTMKFEIFSTLEAAVKWLDYSLNDLKTIEDIISQLKKS